MSHLICTLPWPPSANHAWRAVAGKVHQSEDYRRYKKAVGDSVLEQCIKRHWTRDRLAVAVRLNPPNARSFDIDNRVKTLLDSLVFAGVIYNDRDVDSILIARGSKDAPLGSVLIRIDEWETLDPSRQFETMFDERPFSRAAANDQTNQTSLNI